MTESPASIHPEQLVASPAARDLLAKERPRITPVRIGYLAVAIAVLIYAGQLSDLSFVELFQGSGTMAEYITRYFPPDFSNWRSYLQDTLETVAMGIWGTLLSAILAVPLSILASSNICPAWIVFPVRRVLDTMRAINEVVFALIFVVAVGLGPFAGVLALFIHTAGILAKLFSEAIESIEVGPVEGIRATGASKVQEIVFGVIPQVVPLWTSFTLYRFESNVRSAAVLGIVGAGGIGVSLYQSFRAFAYQDVCAIMIILIITVSLIDTISAKLRQHLV
ncbi:MULTISPECIES: phosphonate ABC transporter, permease protein PhnE [Cyanophyceae]|uniref:phosphonate ABC transporter, permease protein PhnE n=1 Tax=Cyanophyceae TaxID=3028117 RepID=UPI0016839915|nr:MULTISPECIES: phosphonate ABC transporter, permease protein PhnE [Cyanophyceae]MBD1915466.1 phosphonate ABC transporter, permease protein PhnE [Phormidium sp. FACHB-77]MBD2028537.1 phosphonate ABC transporter, permease protein PhnE [Phormidium sp. FACHB-322]MBD2051077.1 phosphonate ABC transporter, permease protein PhnE [Leptolyngbya sp. FACHB-60]